MCVFVVVFFFNDGFMFWLFLFGSHILCLQLSATPDQKVMNGLGGRVMERQQEGIIKVKLQWSRNYRTMGKKCFLIFSANTTTECPHTAMLPVYFHFMIYIYSFF